MLRKVNRPIQHSNYLIDLYPSTSDKPARHVTFQVTEGCQLNCTYCYQTFKDNDSKMTLDTAKSIVDRIFKMREEDSPIIGLDTHTIILDFIGGEPLIMADLIYDTIEYFWTKAIMENSPWVTTFRVSISTNGVAYFSEPVKRLLDRFGSKISMGITVDGDKEMHDECRIFPDGSGSYDLAWAASIHYKTFHNNSLSTKITYCPENIPNLYRSFRHFVDNGFTQIQGNTAFEPLYTEVDAMIFYNEMKKVADYILDNELAIYFALFNEDAFAPIEETEDGNWCGGTGAMLAFDPQGVAYPCLRYMRSSLNGTQKPIVIGNALEGVLHNGKYDNIQKDLESITRRSQSTDECFYCPIGKSCAWCSAYNYQLYGTANKRTVNHCIMHKARALANAYYWFNYELIADDRTIYELHIPEEWALSIISKEEWDMIKALEKKVLEKRKENVL